MNSTADLNATEAEDALIARADKRLAHAYEQVALADEQLARVTEQLSRMEHDATRHPPAVPGRRPSRGRPVLRGLIGLLLAACIAAAAFASQSSHGDAVKLMISEWAPQLISTRSLPLERSEAPAQPSPSAVPLAAAEAAPPQATLSAPATAQGVAPTVAPTSSELALLLQEMTRVLANVEQGVEQLKAGQERMTSDNAKVVEQLRASQEQMTRLIAKASEQNLAPKNLAPKTSAPPPQPVASPTRKPLPTHSSSQARAQPQTPVHLEPKEQ
jgi:hypothetical protein